MRREGFPSNRLFDGAAAGALVISDRVDGVDGLFDGGIPCYRDGVELRSLVDRYLADDALRRSTAERARAAVFARHTFAHRARTILDAAAPFVARAADLAR
jgi:spore maturation protein CgeB